MAYAEPMAGAADSEGVVIEGRAQPLGAYPHVKLSPPFVFVSGTSSRRPDGSIAGAEAVGEGEHRFDVCSHPAMLAAIPPMRHKDRNPDRNSHRSQHADTLSFAAL